MKFLLDANVRFAVGTLLQTLGHDVKFIAGTSGHNLADFDVLRAALGEGRILITNDKDFGQLIFQSKLEHCGVILLRLNHESRDGCIKRIKLVVQMYGSRLEKHFVVVTDDHVRYR